MRMKKTSIIITSAETIGNNPDLLTQIFLRLPTKPLLKFKCVSKQWLSLISNPHFCLCHTRHHQTNGFLTPTALLLKWYFTLPSEFDVVPLTHNNIRVPFFDYMNYAPNINVIQSCYGLFLCESVVDSPKDIISRFFICNPTTKKFKELSFPKKPFQGSKSYVSMAFVPLKSPHYKIVCVRKVSDKSSKYELDIYSSETDSWSLSRISFCVEGSIRFNDAVFCNGKIHWNCYRRDSLYFDVENESLEPLPMPISTMEAPKERSYLGECRGVLYIAVTYFVFICSEFDVFEMDSDYSCWTLKHRLYIGGLVKDFPEIIWSYNYDQSPGFSDVCITQFEKEEDPKVVVWVENKVIFYDFMDGAWKSLYDLRPGVDVESIDKYYHYFDFILPYQSIHANQYFENLSSI
ncbi:F-box protein At5g07610-like [Durio zibethinus]|uniref:F-box protein At5g07610-like n=1 Tax=Durio zibethinus TaxID=66656 RepID=A0A6P5WT96_DURZI|nr:F-box protein At5g07610-like [Durio zibethinus]XP_022718752.1 F-box protein At5g07610-like [Durio zibethinus]XP_022718753.1 F-box protein At5g07610-like [Durio zibethinus]